MFDPHLALAYVDVNDRTVDSLSALPPHFQHFIVVVLGVHNGFRSHAFRW
jgi:hypothetical protein